MMCCENAAALYRHPLPRGRAAPADGPGRVNLVTVATEQ